MDLETVGSSPELTGFLQVSHPHPTPIPKVVNFDKETSSISEGQPFRSRNSYGQHTDRKSEPKGPTRLRFKGDGGEGSGLDRLKSNLLDSKTVNVEPREQTHRNFYGKSFFTMLPFFSLYKPKIRDGHTGTRSVKILRIKRIDVLSL